MARRRVTKKNPAVSILVVCLLVTLIVGGTVAVILMRNAHQDNLDRSDGRDPLPDDFTLTALTDEGTYALSRSLCQSELERLSTIKPKIRSGEAAPTAPLLTAEVPYDMWYDGSQRTFYLPDKYQLTDGELMQLQSMTDSLSVRTITISAAGDLVIGGDPRRQDGETMSSRDWFEKLKKDNGGLDYFLKDVAPIFQGDDMTLVNLECSLTKETATKEKLSFKAPPNYAKMLPAAGIDAVCLANNHTNDYTGQGLYDTRKALKAQGVKSYHMLADRTATFTTQNGVKIGMLGYIMPPRLQDLTAGVDDLRSFKNCDIVIVSFHWTNSQQGDYQVSVDERSIARYAVDAGADLVLGHHKHVVSGIEQYKGKMIVYDLGNFLSTFTPIASFKYTMIYQQTFNVFADGEAQFVGFHIIPVLNSDALGDEPNDGHVHIADQESARKILDQIKAQTPQEELWPLIDEGMKSVS